MNESNKMAGSMTGGMTRTNRAILIAAFILLAAAIGYAIWRDSAPAAAGPAGETAAAPSDQLADLEARTRREPGSADAWTALGAAKFDLGDFAGAIAAYEKAVALSPDSAGLWSALGEGRWYLRGLVFLVWPPLCGLVIWWLVDALLVTESGSYLSWYMGGLDWLWLVWTSLAAAFLASLLLLARTTGYRLAPRPVT